MNFESHFFVANLVYKRLSESLPIKLSRTAFVSANILADYCPLVWDEPQFYSKSWNYVENYIDFITNKVKSKHIYSYIPGISYHLGIITHYITDFFTHSHIGNGIGNPRHHVQYEDFVDNYRRSIRNDLLSKDYLSMINIYDESKDIKENLQYKLEAYRKLPASPNLDLNLAIYSSIEVCVNAVRLRLQNELEDNLRVSVGEYGGKLAYSEVEIDM